MKTVKDGVLGLLLAIMFLGSLVCLGIFVYADGVAKLSPTGCLIALTVILSGIGCAIWLASGVNWKAAIHRQKMLGA